MCRVLHKYSFIVVTTYAV